jgi:hypothetical protein
VIIPRHAAQGKADAQRRGKLCAAPDRFDCVDGLIVVDLRRSPARALERYMTPRRYATFVGSHRDVG